MARKSLMGRILVMAQILVMAEEIDDQELLLVVIKLIRQFYFKGL